MAGRGATTFEKRQKEQNRKEKRLDKLARRQQRKQETGDQPPGNQIEETAVSPPEQPAGESA